MDPTRKRNLIWLASTRSGGPGAARTNLVAAWDVAIDQMVAARNAGDRVGAARWEAVADTLYVQITGEKPGSTVA